MRLASTSIVLPLPTNRTRGDVKLSVKGNTLVIDYDYEHSDGMYAWARLAFKDAIALKYTQAPAAGVDDVTDSRALLCFAESEWLANCRAQWRSHFTGHANALAKAEDFLHYHVFFDDAASVDVIASAVLVSGPPES